MSDIRQNIIDSEWIDCLDRLRDARALILRDAESFHEAGKALERVGQVLCGQVRTGLKKYEAPLLKLANTPGYHDAAEIGRLFGVVREARNMAVHEGAWARHLSSRLIDLFLILEESIMTKMKTVGDIMVRNPVVAETWHLVAHVRQAMLANSFSCLPIFVNNTWCTVSDAAIMRFLRTAATDRDRKVRLSTPLGEAIANKGICPDKADCCVSGDGLERLPALMKRDPLLVTENFGGVLRLLGIITPFDLL